jgi:hypothetical protein
MMYSFALKQERETDVYMAKVSFSASMDGLGLDEMAPSRAALSRRGNKRSTRNNRRLTAFLFLFIDSQLAEQAERYDEMVLPCLV